MSRTVDHRPHDELARVYDATPQPRPLRQWAALMAARASVRDASDMLAGTQEYELRMRLDAMAQEITARLKEIEG